VRLGLSQKRPRGGLQTGRKRLMLFVDDLERTLTLIASHPDIGARAQNAKLENVRRVHLARVHYYLYYRVTGEPSIEVLALWHTRRGADP
jgi:plasmid stabilization system protein ParE